MARVRTAMGSDFDLSQVERRSSLGIARVRLRTQKELS